MLPGGVAHASAHAIEDDDERTAIEPDPPRPTDDAPPASVAGPVDEQWGEGSTTVAGSDDQRLTATLDEPTVEDHGRLLPPLQLVQGQLVQGTATGAVDPRAAAKLHVTAGSDLGRSFDLRPGKDLHVGRAVDNDVVLTDIAVSRRHLDLLWDGDAWVLRDRGSGNGTLINDRIEDGRCELRHGDRIEIGNTMFRFDHPPSATTAALSSWGQEDDEAATVAGKGGRASSQLPIAEPPQPRQPHAPAAAQPRQPHAPATRPKRQSATIEGRQTEGPRPRRPSDPPRAHRESDPPRSHRESDPPLPLPLPQFLASAAPADGPGARPDPFGASSRPMTITAHVEPRAYADAPYPYVAVPERGRQKPLLIAACVMTALAAIGFAAMLAGDEHTPPPQAAGVREPAPWPRVTPKPEVAAVPDRSATVPDPTTVAPSVAVVPPAVVPTVVERAAVPAPIPPAPTPRPAPAAVIVKSPPTAPVAGRPPVPRPVVPKAVPPRAIVKAPPTRVVSARVPTPEPAPPRTLKSSAAVERKADALYKTKDFKGAAQLVRDAAAAALAADDTRRLKALAGDYEAIGTNLTAGSAMAKAKPTDALGALKKALAADRRVGGTHQQVIREKLAQVAPAAAALYMAKQNYPMAKIAADDAVNFGSGTNATVANVRQSLERKAQELHGKATALLVSQPDEARSMMRQITKIVPTDSPWYSKAYKFLNQRPTPARDDDE